MSLFIGLPTYDGRRENGMAVARVLKETKPEYVGLVEFKGSLLSHSFNSLWASALNMRTGPVPVQYFLLWHADVIPRTPGWLNVFFLEMEKHGADVLSAVIPIKNELGMTSTARDTDRWEPRRYSTTEVKAMAEPTWTEPDLLVNTGLMLVDFTKPWVEQICFTINDEIRHCPDGKWRAYAEPEDWGFSRQAHKLGASIFATKAVHVDHVGSKFYSNQDAWGFADTEAWRESLK